MERFQLLVAVAILLVRDNKILLTRRFNTGYFDGFYECPAGHIDGKETIREAAVRELKEEIGVIATADDMKVVHVVHRYGEKHERIEFYLMPKKWDNEPVINEPHLCDDLAWFPINQLPENIIPKTKAAIESYLNGDFYSEFNWNALNKI